MFRSPPWQASTSTSTDLFRPVPAPPPGLFTMVELEVNSRCNLRCEYCPVSVAPPASMPRLMAQPVMDRVIAELARLGFAGRLSYHFYNEPLLHPNLDRLVDQVRRGVPGVRQVLYTNGELLTDEKHRVLVEAGVERFIITRHTGKPVPDRERQTVLEPSELVLTNRGGAMGPETRTLTLPCHVPNTMLIVTVTGDVLLCYEDYHRTQPMGSILERPLDEIWFSERFVRLRSHLVRGDRTQTEICRHCTNRAHLTPEPFDYVL
ncbi:MAG: SPASM domain-containing protein [Candidatus Riflebacteria bacterium]|nr:SPASM domain-containing protein [Candidatus Riflebacteria bacterium]